MTPHSSLKFPDLVGNRRESAQDLGGRKMRGVVRVAGALIAIGIFGFIAILL
jgi:hypothetical protein